jgi:hypothetical protein
VRTIPSLLTFVLENPSTYNCHMGVDGASSKEAIGLASGVLELNGDLDL